MQDNDLYDMPCLEVVTYGVESYDVCDNITDAFLAYKILSGKTGAQSTQV